MDYDETKYVNVSKLDVKDFTKLLEQTKGEVYLIDDKDNKINLKSKLSQLIGLSNIIEAGKISNAKFYFKDPEDSAIFFRYNLYKNKGDKTDA